MPEPTGRGSREFLDSANQALSELEEATGKPVLIVEAPELKVRHDSPGRPRGLQPCVAHQGGREPRGRLLDRL